MVPSCGVSSRFAGSCARAVLVCVKVVDGEGDAGTVVEVVEAAAAAATGEGEDAEAALAAPVAVAVTGLAAKEEETDPRRPEAEDAFPSALLLW